MSQGQHEALAQRAINTIRFLSADAVEKADSGHPGLPMGAAPMGYVLWQHHLRHNPRNPAWHNRDRFVLSAGHGSMLLYSLLHLTGYDLSLDDIKAFRQFGSKTPGHPEYDHTPGVETTTGPLGQGFANGVGMALAEKHLRAIYGPAVVDHFTYAIVSDGDLMEGISHEAASLAGHLGLGKLIYLYDSNHISIDGSTDLAFTDDTVKRFEAYNWHVVQVGDGNDIEAVDRAIMEAKAVVDKPSLIVVRTIIGFGSPNRQGTQKAHGEPLGKEELALTRANLGWDHPPFFIPEDVLAHMREAVAAGAEAEKSWEDAFASFKVQQPELAAQYARTHALELPDGWDSDLPWFDAGESLATRAASGKALGAIASHLPELIGGSADLTPSNKTDVKGRKDFQAHNPEGQYLRFGVREHGMASICNGMALHGGLRPYCGTFLIFSDYLRPAARLSALMKLPVTYVFTHDSIGLGEDGPTHQPVEQLMALRAIPGLTVLRPADPNETVEAWRAVIEHPDRPFALALSRQNLPVIDTDKYAHPRGLQQGAYILRKEEGTLDLILMATGSEVQIALEAAEKLAGEKVGVRVVSMPSWELFEDQTQEYRDSVLPPTVSRRISIEAGITLGWHQYVGREGVAIGIDQFGASAPYELLMQSFGFSVEAVVEHAKRLLA